MLVDFGAKSGILRDLTKRGCDVVVVPHDTTAEQIRRLKPDGIHAVQRPWGSEGCPSCGENDPRTARRIPIFGICLGHQLFALACGADTEKLKFGHRGGNHPVKDLETDAATLLRRTMATR